MINIGTKLMKLKDKIDTLKKEIIEITALREDRMKTLKSEFGCKSVEDAEKKLKKLEEQETTWEKNIQKALKEIEDEYGI